MHLFTVILIAILLSNNRALADHLSQFPVVNTSLGSIKGSILTSRLGKNIFAFRGIRYAKPPIEDLRFRPPQPVDPWENLLDATEDGPMCPQPAYNRSEVSEDCLRLNIYTKQIPGKLIRIQPQNVLVYIHPGGFYAFSGQSHNNAGPQYLMDQDIVLVTINYRLGSLGFMSTGTEDCPGNAGLKDQVMALRWIRNHISSFGGNPDSVTLMGYSAGALSTTLHLISPMSRGLFHRAIVMSAAATSQVKIPTDQIELARKQAALLGCPVIPADKMMACLRKKPATDYADSLEYMFVISWNPVLLWKPVIEPNFGQERFLDQDPTEAFLKGDFMKVPIIAGITKDEFAGPAVAFLRNETLRNELDLNFDTLAPILFLYERHTEESKNRSRLLREEFLRDEPLSLNNSLQGLNYLFADSLIGFAMHRFVQLASRHTLVYQYKFSYVGRYSFLYYPYEKTPYGAVHHDDLLYLLSIPSRAPIFNVTDPENLTVERLTGMWSAFANTGDPNNAQISMPHWKPVTKTDNHYLNIGQVLTMEIGLFAERFAIWDQLFPLPTENTE
ncbi:juvenile hormone esterase-like [Malaya genurostris]|uniref:juvenile hormone esterase-like n=1 Tax=Malaya genurostris TaxID=325434 RepID=UPI0026F3CDB4|nr:juvenile hormone esterase-like [Malaya genurostris]